MAPPDLEPVLWVGWYITLYKRKGRSKRLFLYAGALVFLFSFIPLFLSFHYFDCLVRYQHEHCHDDWIRDGKPTGIFWIRPNHVPFEGRLSRNSLMGALLFFNKQWIDSNADMRYARRKHRFFTLCTYLSYSIFLAIMIAYAYYGK